MKKATSTAAKNASTCVFDPSARISQAVQYHRRAESSAHQMAIWGALCGLELKAMKKECGHGEWQSFYVAKVEKLLPLRTGQYYMTVAEGLKVKAKDRAALEALLATPAGQLTDAQRAKLAKVVRGIADGETMASLIEAYRISKRPAGSQVAGGYRPDPKKLAEFLAAYHSDLVGTPYDKLTPEVQAHFRKWTTKSLEDPGQLAFDFCRPILDAFEHPDFAGLLHQLPAAEKQRMLDHAEALVRQLRDEVRADSRKAA